MSSPARTRAVGASLLLRRGCLNKMQPAVDLHQPLLKCLAGYQVAKDAFGGAFNSEHLKIGAKRWRLNRGKDDDSGKSQSSLSLSLLPM